MSTLLPPSGDADKRVGAFTAPLSVSAQDIPNMTVKVRAGSFFNSQNTFIGYVGGNSLAMIAPVSNAMWVIVALTDVGSLVLINGTSAPTPSFPSIPSGNMPLAAVYLTSTTTSITTGQIIDVRPFLHSTNVVPDLTTTVAALPTFADMNTALAAKADTGGTSSVVFTLNESLVGPPTQNISLVVDRGTSTNVSLRWNESMMQWEATNDGSTFFPLNTSGGPLVLANITDITASAADVNQLTGVVLSSVYETQSAATTALALKLNLSGGTMSGAINMGTSNKITNMADPSSSQDAATQAYVIAQDGLRVAKTGDTMTGNLVITTTGGMPNMLYSAVGESGLQISRTGFPSNPAILKWDESSQLWEVGIVGVGIDSILTSAVVSGKVNIAGDTMTGNLDFGGTHKVTGLAAATTNGDAVRYEQLTGLSTVYQPLDATLTSLAAVSGSQGDLLYASGTDTWTNLAKNTSGTRYLSNTGTSSNPAWAQVDLTAGVTGTLPFGNGGTGVSSTPTSGQLLIGNGTNYTLATITAGPGVNITNGAGSITVSAQTLKGTTGFTFGAIATSDVGDSTNTLTITGASVGDIVTLGLPSSVPAGFTYEGYVSASDTVTIRAHGSASSGTGADAADATINVIVMKYASF